MKKFDSGTIDLEEILNAVNLNRSLKDRLYNTLPFEEQHRVNIGVILAKALKDKRSQDDTNNSKW